MLTSFFGKPRCVLSSGADCSDLASAWPSFLTTHRMFSCLASPKQVEARAQPQIQLRRTLRGRQKKMERARQHANKADEAQNPAMAGKPPGPQ